MNKLKALLIAGLLSLSSVSFATSLTTLSDANGNLVYGADGSRGTIELLNDGNSAQLTGDFTASNGYDEFYNINGVTPDTTWLMSFGQTVDSSNTNVVTISLLEGATYATSSVVDSGVGSLDILLDVSNTYYLLLSGSGTFGYSVDVSAVPVPAAGILFASALFGAGAFGRRKKKSAKTSMVGAFARAS